MLLNKKIKILLFGSGIWYFGEGMFGPLFAVFAQKIGGNILDISWAWAIYLIATGVLLMVIGKLSDHSIKLKEKLMIFGYALNAVFTFAYLLVSSPWHLFFVQLGLGIAAALATPTWVSLYTKYLDGRYSGFYWGFFEGQTQIIIAAAIIVGGLVVNYFSFATLFITMGIIQIIATIAQALILKKHRLNAF